MAMMMSALAYTLFSTSIGVCGVVWSERGIVGVELPGPGERETRRRLLRRFSGAVESPPPPTVQSAIAGILALLAGEPRDLTAVALDLDGVADFDLGVYRIARTIGPGETLTYGEIAARLGRPDAAREVGRALGANPVPIVVPCHRVLGAGGKVGGFSARGGVATKARLLSIEGARTSTEPMLFDDLQITVRSGRKA
jgi:methylated-DNA-[protein]-cysteine S-methyltransferase